MNITSFERFLAAVCDDFPIHRLRKRIRTELSNHMEDMLADFLAQGMEENTAYTQVLTEMGDPEMLRMELRQAYKPTIWRIRVQRLAGLAAAFCFCLFVLIPIGDELRTYHYSKPLDEAEAYLSAACKEVGALHLLGEVEYNGRLYRYYMPNQQEKGHNRVYCMESVRVFGKELQNRFSIAGTMETDGGMFMDDLHFSACSELQAYANDATLFHWRNTAPQEKAMVLIFTEPSDVRYFQAQLPPKDEYTGYPQHDAPACGETPYYEVSEASPLLMVTYPTDMCLGAMRFLDADKNAADIPHSTYDGGSTGIKT